MNGRQEQHPWEHPGEQPQQQRPRRLSPELEQALQQLHQQGQRPQFRPHIRSPNGPNNRDPLLRRIVLMLAGMIGVLMVFLIFGLLVKMNIDVWTSIKNIPDELLNERDQIKAFCKMGVIAAAIVVVVALCCSYNRRPRK